MKFYIVSNLKNHELVNYYAKKLIKQHIDAGSIPMLRKYF